MPAVGYVSPDGSTVVPVSAATPMPSQIVGSVNTTPTTSGSETNRSGTLTTGGTAQQIMAANPTRSYIFIQNNDNTPLWFRFGATAQQSQPSRLLNPGDVYERDGGRISPDTVSVIGPTTGKQFTAYEG